MNCALVPCLATRLLRRAAWAVVASLFAFVSSIFAQPNAPHAFRVEDPTPSSLQLKWGDSSSDAGYQIERSSDRVNFTALAVVGTDVTTFADEAVSPDTSYWYRIRAIGAGNPPTYSGYVTAKGRTTFTRPLASLWNGWDVGNPTPAGSESAQPPALTMRAGGSDIFGAADAFRYHAQTAVGGNLTVIARVDSMTNTHAWAKAGVMIRSSLKADSANAAMLLTAGNVCSFQARVFGGEETSHTSGGWRGAPYWVKLQREGDTFRGYISPDGTNWTLVGTQDIAMPEQVYVGIAGCSHDAAAQTVIAFSNVSVVTQPYPPFAASHLQATVTGDHSIRITWRDNSSSETGFKIYIERDRRHSPNPTMVVVVPANMTSWESTGLAANSTYSFHVKAERDGLEAPTWDPYIDIFLPQAADEPPLTPYDIEVTQPDANANTLRVRWPDENTTETGFAIERSTQGNAFVQVATTAANVALYQDTNVTPGTTYSYRVRAVNAAGYSGYSPVGSLQVAGNGAPAAPTGLFVSERTDSSLRVTWTDASSDEEGFEVERAAGSGEFTHRGWIWANNTSFTDVELGAGQTYSYRVRAYKGTFNSAFTTAVTGTTTVGTSSPPYGGWVTRYIGNAGVEGPVNGIVPTMTMGASGTDIFGSADGFRFTSKTATGDMTVVARVASMTNTHPWAKAGVTIRASLSPDAPNVAMLLTAGNNCVFQTRATPTGATTSTSGGWFQAPYWVKVSRVGNTFSGYISPDGVTWKLVGSQEIAMAGYLYAGVAGCSHDPTTVTTISFTNIAVTTVPDPSVLPAPTNFRAVDVTSSGARLTWTDNSSDETGFRIWYDRDDRESQGLDFFTVGPNVTSVPVGLSPDAPYVFMVEAYRGGESSSSGWIEVRALPEEAPPIAPPNIAVYGRGNWIEVSYEGSPTATGYEIERASTNTPFAVIATIADGIYSDTGLAGGTTYSYRMRAFNAAGYSPYSYVESLAVGPIPNTPAGLAVTGRTDTTLQVSWTDTSTDETLFLLQRELTGSAPYSQGWATFQLAPNTTSFTDTGLVPGTSYTYRVYAYGSDFGSPFSNAATASTLTAPPSSGWTPHMIGNTGRAGSVIGQPPAVTLKAGGDDIFGRADSFQAMFQPATGDTTIVARVASMTNTHAWAKAGVMIRSSLDANATNAAMLLTAGNVSVFQARTLPGNDTVTTNGAWVRAPYWVKLTRTGSTFRGYLSPDGTNWTLVGTQEIAMNNQVYVGLAGSSHNLAALTDISFANINVVTGSPGLAAPTNFRASNVTARGARLTWVDNSSDEDGFRIWYDRDDRDGTGLQVLTTTGPGVTSYDASLSANTPYVFLIESFKGSETSSGGSIELITPQASDGPPQAPDDLTVTRSAPNTLEVRWPDLSTTETGFEIERGNADGSFTRVGTVGVNVTSYTQSGLTSGTTYVYRVRAGNAAGYSAYSPVGSASALGAPADPTSLAIGARTESTLQVNWTDASSDETGFKVERAPYDGEFVAIATLGANATTFTDTGLYVGHRYSYRVRAFNSDFYSGYSPVATGDTTGGGGYVLPSGWSGVNVGNATGSESAQQYPGISMRASGADIYGTGDDFRFWYLTEEGDLTIVARISSMTNTDPWAKTGVMVRTGNSRDAANVAMLLTTGNASAFQARTTTGGATTHQAGAWARAPYWVKLTRVGNLFSGFISPDGTTWTLVGTQEVAMPRLVFVGVAGCSHKPGVETVIGIDQVDLTVPPPAPPVPLTWTRQSWNAASSSATPNAAGDGMVIKGMSPDLWARSDGGTFMYRPTGNDDMLVVGVDAVTQADPYSKAGVMFRATLDAASPNVSAVVTPDRGVFLQVRKTPGDVTTLVKEVPGVRPPVVFFIARSGNSFFSSYSTDNGATWRGLGEVSVTMPENIYLGPVATSHNPAAESTATFSRISDE